MIRRHLHVSLHHSLTGAETGRYLRRLINVEDPGSFQTTECQGAGEVAVVRSMLPEGWKVTRLGEFLYGWRTDQQRRTIRKATLIRLSHVYEGREDWRDFHIARFPMRLIGDGVCDFWDGHAPSGVQAGGDWAWANRDAVKASRTGFTAWGKLIRRAGRFRPNLHHIAGFDSNLAQQVVAFRHYLGETLTIPSALPGNLQGGTHPRVRPRRWIDTFHTTRKRGRSTLRVISCVRSTVKPPERCDHWAVVLTYEVTKRPLLRG